MMFTFPGNIIPAWDEADEHRYTDAAMNEDRMLKWFEFSHLPSHLQDVSMPFAALAQTIVELLQPGPERTVALRKLLEAKDAAVRATVQPGG